MASSLFGVWHKMQSAWSESPQEAQKRRSIGLIAPQLGQAIA
jgi:hypothetical protein